MDVTFIILIGGMLILLLLTVFMLMMVSKLSSTPEQKSKHKAKGHLCNECMFCKTTSIETKCIYFREDNINPERPACIHYEEKEEYRPA